MTIYAETIVHDMYVSATIDYSQVKAELEHEEVCYLVDCVDNQTVFQREFEDVLYLLDSLLSVTIYDRTVTGAIAFTDVNGSGRIWSATISQSLTLVESNLAPRTINDQLVLGQVIVGTASHFISQTLEFADTCEASGSLYGRTLSDTIEFTQSITGGLFDPLGAVKGGFSKSVSPQTVGAGSPL